LISGIFGNESMANFSFVSHGLWGVEFWMEIDAVDIPDLSVIPPKL
jgi:hypothetical protein